jgi:ectoine hydroxylase-related dioxygenase (phytanoyl-CoA dioxygenase family)
LTATATFENKGYVHVPELISSEECETIARLYAQDGDSAGSRNLLQHQWCEGIAARLQAQLGGLMLMPAGHTAIQCTYFQKSADRNWLVPVHQDLGIPVAERNEESSLTNWSEKDGMLFVQPPIALLEQMVAVRLHLDPCGADDGPLRVVPGSHLLGRISPEEAARARKGTEVACISGQGGVLVMRPLLLHASSKSTGKSRRRVLHFVFGPLSPGYGLHWPRKVLQPI